MKISLVYPPTFEVGLKGYPLGMGYLLSSLNQEHDVAVYNYSGKDFNESIKAFLSMVRRERPQAVGISFNSFNRWGAYALIKRIKKIDPAIHAILGGVHPSVMHAQIFKYFYNEVDFILQSEGDCSFAELCRHLEDGTDFRNVNGLVYKDGKGGLAVNRVTGFVEDLDDLPLPDYSYAADEIRRKQSAYLITSRGCPVNCSFCSTSSFWGQNVRKNSVGRVMQEVEGVMRMGAKRIFFHDDTFNLGIPRTIELAGELKKLGVEYGIQCRVVPVNEEMITALVDSGCRHITWGVESLSEKILSTIHKGITREKVIKAFDLCVPFADRMTTSAFFCVGTPGETEETIRETIDYANKHLRSTHGPRASMLYILPGTRIYTDLIQKKKFDERIWVKKSHVYYYTQEHPIYRLNRWRKMINRSGIRIPYSGSYFWDELDGSAAGEANPPKRANWIRRSTKKLRRNIRMILGHYS